MMLANITKLLHPASTTISRHVIHNATQFKQFARTFSVTAPKHESTSSIKHHEFHLAQTAKDMEVIKQLVTFTASEVIEPRISGLATKTDLCLMQESILKDISHLRENTDIKFESLREHLKIMQESMQKESKIMQESTQKELKIMQESTQKELKIMQESMQKELKDMNERLLLKIEASEKNIKSEFYNNRMLFTRWIVGGSGVIGLGLLAYRLGFFDNAPATKKQEINADHVKSCS